MRNLPLSHPSLEEPYRMTPHARQRISERWPDTVLRPQSFEFFSVNKGMPIFGYCDGAYYVEVTGTPMVAVVENDMVLTVYEIAVAEKRLRWHGYSRRDLYHDDRAA